YCSRPAAGKSAGNPWFPAMPLLAGRLVLLAVARLAVRCRSCLASGEPPAGPSPAPAAARARSSPAGRAGGEDARTGGLKPTWTTASFLLYAGGLAVLFAAVRALDFLSSRYPKAGFVGWAGLVFAGLALLTFLLWVLDRWMAAGVFGFAAVIAFAVL